MKETKTRSEVKIVYSINGVKKIGQIHRSMKQKGEHRNKPTPLWSINI